MVFFLFVCVCENWASIVHTFGVHNIYNANVCIVLEVHLMFLLLEESE